MIGKDVFKNIAYHTRLLESLDWDESQLTALLEYLDAELNSTTLKHPTDIAKSIQENFGDRPASCFTSIINEVMFSYNLHKKGTEYEN